MFRRSCPVPAGKRPPWHTRLGAATLAPIGGYLSRQAARPHGPAGLLLGWNWIHETTPVNDTAIDLLAPAEGERILEIGFGPGRTPGRLAAAGADVIGIETSPTMLAAASPRNASHIAAGRVQLRRGDGITLPAPDQSVDAVISVHTIYFWPDPPDTLTDIARVLRPGGRLVLAFRPGEHPLPARFDPKVYRVPTTSQVTQWLHAAGFAHIRAEQREGIPSVVWLVST